MTDLRTVSGATAPEVLRLHAALALGVTSRLLQAAGSDVSGW
jgi:hypothetical protein